MSAKDPNLDASLCGAAAIHALIFEVRAELDGSVMGTLIRASKAVA